MKKTFDCIEFKREAALHIYRETKGMSNDQLVEYWRKKSDESMRRHARRRKPTPPTRPHP